MPTPERRRDARITCRLSLTLRGEWANVDGTVLDVSRTGFRLRLPLGEIGLQRGATLSQIASQLHHILSKDVVASFLPELLGPLVTRHIEPRALSLPHEDPESVEIGAFFDAPLGRVEAAAIGLPIPMEAESSEDAARLAPAEPPRVHAPASRAIVDDGESWSFEDLQPRPAEVRAHLLSVRNPLNAEILGRVESIFDGTFTVRILDRSQFPFPVGLRDPDELTDAFQRAFGEDMMLRLESDGGDLWSGRAQVEGIEASADAPDTVVLRLHGGQSARTLDPVTDVLA